MALKSVPFVPQMEAVECGAACLASILKYHGAHVPLHEVRYACRVTRDGVNAKSILEAARSYGLEAEMVTLKDGDLEHLMDVPLPAILHWGFGHFVVLEALKERGAWIVDPSRGRTWVDRQKLGDLFTGVALCFAPDDTFTLRPNRLPSLARYLAILRATRGSLVQILGASTMIQLAALIPPIVAQVLVDWVILPRSGAWLPGLALTLAVMVLSKGCLTGLRGYLLGNLRARLDLDLMTGFVGHMIRLPLGFFLQRMSGDLLYRVESNSRVRDLMSTAAISSLLDLTLLLGFGILMLAYDWRLGLLVVALQGLRMALVLRQRTALRQFTDTELAIYGAERSVLEETLSGLETVFASGSQEQIQGLFADRLTRRLNTTLARSQMESVYRHAGILLQGLCLALLFWFGGRRVVGESMTMGVFAAFVALQGLFQSSLDAVLNAVTGLQMVTAHLERLDDVMSSPQEASGTTHPGSLKGEIRLEGVGFRYQEGSPWILRNITTQVRAGERIAIVGSTGGGKTTLANLLLGLLEPTEGRILLDGQDLRHLDTAAVRSQIGAVPQDSVLFEDTVRANLSVGDPELPLHRLEWAARLACADRLIASLPQGWKTVLAENGRTLSGGERQRLCLARALTRDPRILLLDEATSSLDLDTERRVHANLMEIGCTRILIAHRLETVKDADRILVVKDGEVVEEGTFDDLAAGEGFFNELVTAMEAGR